MPLSWIAADVRARLLAHHRLGRGGVRALSNVSLAAALEDLRDSPYGAALEEAAVLADAQHALAASVLWNLRVLAGWLPPGGAESLRTLAAWFEIANVQARLAHFLSGGAPPRLFELGTLETAARRLAAATSPSELRLVLASSRWGDPGGSEPAEILNGMRAAWYQRVHAFVPEASSWADAALVLWTARARFSPGAELRIPLPRLPGAEAATFHDMATALPGRLAWVLEGVDSPTLLWRAEARWWQRVEQDSLRMLAGWQPGSRTVVATAALLAADAWRVRAALAGFVDPGPAREAHDAVA